nr:hypothetical protein [Tanacetum cinerariifolium]
MILENVNNNVGEHVEFRFHDSLGKRLGKILDFTLVKSNHLDFTSLGYGDQLSESDSEVLPSVFDSRSSDGDDNPTNDRFKKGDGYHAVPPPLTGNYMPPLADLSFVGLDDSVYRLTANKAIASISKGEPSVIKTSNISVEMPKVDSVRTSRVIIKDWVKKVNGVVQIQALVDGKRVNIKESSIRRILRLDDAEVPKPHHGMSSVALWHLPSFILLPIRNSISQAKIKKLESRVERLEEENRALKDLKGVHSTVDFDEPVMEKEESSKQGRKIANLDANVEINLGKVQAEAYNLDLDHQEKVLSMLDVNDEELADTPITAAEASKVIVEVPKPRKKRGVIIQDPEETTTTDDEVARQLEAELNVDINWNAVIEQFKRSERLTDANMAGYKMNYFKGMSYDEIRPLFEKHYNYNQAFLNEVNEGIKVPEKEVRQEKEVKVESSKKEGENLEQEIAKKQKME